MAVVVRLLEYSAADVVSKRGKPGNPLIGNASKYVAKPGETWGSVAKAVFKKSSRWQEIAKLNGRQHDHSSSQIVKHGGEVAVTLPSR